MSGNLDPLLLIGAGPMAIEYAKVLKALKVEFIVIGRSEESAKTFEEKTGAKVLVGGIENFLRSKKSNFTQAIIATGVEQLSDTTKILLNNGVSKILLEKPGGLYKDKLIELAELAKKNKAKILIAYNRRFYASAIKAREIIKEDGGILSFQFDFTEWSHIIESLNKPEIVKQRWFLSNSTHVADLAFFMGGKPKELHVTTSGTLVWHNSASIFAGSGLTENDIIFSYSANWISPGRWSVELLTRNYRLIFKPMEQLAIQKKGTVTIESVEIDDAIDKTFKPGVYKMVDSFLKGDYEYLCSLSEQIQMFDTYSKIANYK